MVTSRVCYRTVTSFHRRRRPRACGTYRAGLLRGIRQPPARAHRQDARAHWQAAAAGVRDVHATMRLRPLRRLPVAFGWLTMRRDAATAGCVKSVLAAENRPDADRILRQRSATGTDCFY